MPALKSSVAAELIRLLYQHVPAVLAANVVNSSLVMVVLWDQASRPVLLGWVAAVLLLNFIRFGLWMSCRRRPVTEAQAIRWGFPLTLGAMVSGLLWGSTAFLFARLDDPASLILVSFVIGGMAAGAVTSLSAHLPAFYLYLLASMLPFELRLLTFGDRFSLGMSGMAAVYVIGLVIIGRNFNAALIQALVLNEENKRLLLTREQEVLSRTADLQAANTDLQREIAERRKTEGKLEEARAEAERANQAKSRFLAAASHDLRQPLQSMFLFASSLHRFVSDKRGVDALLRIERGLDILKSMLDSLLDLTRLDVNVIQPQITVFPLGPMLDDIVIAYRRIAASKGIQLKSNALADIPVRSDQTLLGRMVRNLVENAIRYTERGQIILSCRRSGERVCIQVEDSGIGIAPDQMKLIFEEFHQVGNPERDKAQGLGLGLAIVQRLSVILAHPVEVHSEFGSGSTFTIAVPIAAEAAMTQAPVIMADTVDGHDGQHVVVVDDDPMVLLGLSTIFEQWGYGVIMAGSEDEALSQLQTHPTPHLIVADYRLRNGRVGTDAIRGIRAKCGTEIPSIVLTGEAGSEPDIAAEAVGAIKLHKPVTPNDLAFALNRLMGQGGSA